MLMAVETDSAISSRDSLTLCPALTNRSSISGQLRLDTSHLIIGDKDDFSMTKSNNFGKFSMHSSGASIIK